MAFLFRSALFWLVKGSFCVSDAALWGRPRPAAVTSSSITERGHDNHSQEVAFHRGTDFEKLPIASKAVPCPPGVATDSDSDVALGWGGPGSQSGFRHALEQVFLFCGPATAFVP